MKQRFTLALASLCLLAAFHTKAQDMHFSQFYMTPLMQNPGLTGFFDGSYRVSGIARSQWKSVTTPYRTIGGALDLNMRSGFNSQDMLGVGLNVMSDRAGDAQFTTTRVDLSTAYSKSLDNFNRGYLSTGIQLSYTSAYIDYARLTFDENFENGQTTENFAFNAARYADASAGVQYTYIANKRENFTVGGAVFHINKPKLTFMGDNSSHVFRKYVLNAGATVSMGRNGKLFPKANYSVQGPNSELNFGAFTSFDLNTSKDVATYFGLLHRWKDAVILVTRVDVQDLAVTFSYDMNYSKLSRVSHGLGGPELSVQYIGSFKRKANKKVFCPVF